MEWSWGTPRVNDTPHPKLNFYEKALFVKVDVATALWLTQPLCALRAMLLSALSVSQLSSDSVHYGIRLFELETLQSSDRLPRGYVKFACAVASRDPKRSGNNSRGHPPLCGRLAALCAIFTSSLCACSIFLLRLSRLLPLFTTMGVVERIVGLPRDPQPVQEHTELPGHGHRSPLLCVLAASGGYLLPVAP